MRYIYSFALFFFFTLSANAAAFDQEKQCLDLLRDELSDRSIEFDFPENNLFEEGKYILNVATDSLTGLYFDEKLFELNSYNNGGDWSRITKGEMMPPYTLFDSGSADTYLFAEEVNTLKNLKNDTLLHCSFRKFDFEEARSFYYLNKNALGLIDVPKVFEIDAFEHNGIKYKKVYVESLMRDLRQDPFATIKTISFVPYSDENKGIYNPYSLINEKQRLWSNFLQNIGVDFYNSDKVKNLELVYEDDVIKFEVADTLPNGIRPNFVNEVLFTYNTFFNWNRHFLFMEMLKANQDWAEKVITVTDKVDGNKWPEDGLTTLDWVLFTLQNKQIDPEKVNVGPYYKDHMNIAKYEYVNWNKSSEVEFNRTVRQIFRTFIYQIFYENDVDFELLKTYLIKKRDSGYSDFNDYYDVAIVTISEEAESENELKTENKSEIDSEGEGGKSESMQIDQTQKDSEMTISKNTRNRYVLLIALGVVLILLALALKKTSFSDKD